MRDGSGGKRGSWALLLMGFLSVLIVVLERVHTRQEPLETDITTYAVIGHEMLQGRSLYSDLWDHKPPALHTTFALGELLAGYGPSEILLLNIFFTLVTMGGIFLAGRMAGGDLPGIWAALAWALVSGDLYLEANQPNAELFMNAFLSWAFVIWPRLETRSFQGRWVLALGSLIALASLYKHIAVIPAFIFGAYHVLNTGKDRRRTAFLQASSVLMIVVVFWGLTFGYFLLQGHLEAMKLALLDYNRIYTNFASDTAGQFVSQISSLDFPASSRIFLLCLFLVGAVPAWRSRRERSGLWGLWACSLISSVLEIVLPGRFHPHYYQLLLPTLVIGAAWGLQGSAGWIPRGLGAPRWVLPVLFLLLLAGWEFRYYRLSPEEWSRTKYGPHFIESYALTDTVNGLLEPGETFYEWGDETSLYFTTRRPPPTGIFYLIPLKASLPGDPLNRQVISDLERSRPELVVFNTAAMSRALMTHPVFLWLRSHYRRVPGMPQRWNYLFLVRGGGELEKRLARGHR